MPKSFTPAFMDKLSDDVLKTLQILLVMTTSPEREKSRAMLNRVLDKVEGLSDSQLESLLIKVNAAMERRFGPVPGI